MGKEIGEKLPDHNILIVDGKPEPSIGRYLGDSLKISNPPNIVLASLKTVGGTSEGLASLLDLFKIMIILRRWIMCYSLLMMYAESTKP